MPKPLLLDGARHGEDAHRIVRIAAISSGAGSARNNQRMVDPVVDELHVARWARGFQGRWRAAVLQVTTKRAPSSLAERSQVRIRPRVLGVRRDAVPDRQHGGCIPGDGRRTVREVAVDMPRVGLDGVCEHASLPKAPDPCTRWILRKITPEQRPCTTKPRQSEGREKCPKDSDRSVMKVLGQILAAGVQIVSGERGILARVPERVQGEIRSPRFSSPSSSRAMNVSERRG
jgi:hypothetical protein